MKEVTKNEVEYIRNFCVSYDYPEDVIEQCCLAFQKIQDNENSFKKFNQAMDLLFSKDEVVPEAYLSILRECAGEVGLNIYIVPLVFYIHATRILNQLYDEIQLPEWVRRNTLQDLLFKVDECVILTGHYGLYSPQWFYGYFRLRRFGLGRLQYDILEYAGEPLEVGNRQIKKGDYILKCHIPRCKQSFGAAERLESYKLAYGFFKERYPERFLEKEIPILCISWLLFPKHEQILSPESNIIGFLKEFKLYDVAYDYENTGTQLWRIFNKPYQGKPEEMPACNSLQKGYKKWLMEGEPVGCGYGIMLFDGEKIHVE